ncbi:indolepyruvate oxidoreductase subunit beta [Chrysiogenes arsenatis]|uniref:indolepyruvate oxidoreductase subunit beta n=1 Tax=Chrysiogenes arsenatis TaxID=309797 RepID=UPI00041D91B1|nr:indolepyruvate oxidoreductase subunit beta [Chrysiogenes arsenatis]
MSKITNILIAGVGGQGILLASEILSEIALRLGLDVKKSEVHGMAQRGGSVVSHVRIGEKVFSPLIAQGASDFLLSFEKMETLRWQGLIGPQTVSIINDTRIVPTNVNVGIDSYPEDLDAYFQQNMKKYFLVDASQLATEAGTIKATNVVLIGSLARLMHYDKQIWLDVIQEKVPPKTVAVNTKAFELGYNAVAQ